MRDREKDYAEGRLDTTDGKPPKTFDAGVPDPETTAGGQHKAYWILSDAERAKGFIRPVRHAYRHVGTRPAHPTRELTADERERYAEYNYVAFEEYPDGGGGQYWTQAGLESGCGSVTTMGRGLAETYARQPVGFYSSTFCVRCGKHLPVGERGEFVWDDGSNERVGT